MASITYRTGIAASLLGLGFASASALAYIPPSQFIVRTLAQKHVGPKGLRVKSMVTGLEGEKPTAARFKTVTTYNPGTRSVRSLATDESGRELYSIERRGDQLTLAELLNFDGGARAIAVALRAKGVPVRTDEEVQALDTEEERYNAEPTRLARLNATFAWVIGRGDKNTSQLWVEKDSFLPLRVVFPGDGTSDLSQVDFESYRYHQEFAYPRQITALRKGVPVLRDEMSEISLGAVETFAEMRGFTGGGWTEAGKSAPDAVRALVESYYSLVR